MSSPTSQETIKVQGGAVRNKVSAPETLNPLVERTRRRDIFNALLFWRTVNAALLWTFFQPDEYYQAQEPAWKLAFGEGVRTWQNGALDGPWITWEWQNSLRSSLFPVALGAVFKAVGALGEFLFPPVIQSKLLLAPPKLVGILSATVMEYYNWKLAERVFGPSSIEGTAVLLLSATSPWQWYVSTRTFGNCIETALTAVALYHWPWSWFTAKPGGDSRIQDTKRLVYCLFFAAIATILRPTNLIIWIVLAFPTLVQASTSERAIFIRKAVSTGIFVASSSAMVDALYYEKWTFPPLNFFVFNVGQDIAVFYGGMRLDYYFTEGIPLLLMTVLPFSVVGYFQALSGTHSTSPSNTAPSRIEPAILRTLAVVVLVVATVLSLVAHKEVRFIYPILPALYLLAARPVVSFFHPFPSPSSAWRKAVLGILVSINLVIAIYLGSFHGRGIVSSQAFLRAEHERLNTGMTTLGETANMNVTTVAFLMPCHSVPWRSNLIYPGIEAWALTCDPPLGLSVQEKGTYLDEADVFYNDPVAWIKRQSTSGQRLWPMYLVFFEQLTADLNKSVAEGSYEEAWRGFNSLFHDDWRRSGDVVVWVKTKDFGGPGRAENPAPLGSRKVPSSFRDALVHGEL